jgi:hypothetical protein
MKSIHTIFVLLLFCNGGAAAGAGMLVDSVYEAWVARYDAAQGFEYANALAVDGSGNVYVTGKSGGLGTNDDYATIKYDASGIQQWVARYNGYGDLYDAATAVAVDSSGNVYVTGYSQLAPASFCVTIKYVASGIQQWARRSPGIPGTDIAVDGLGNVYVTGRSGGLFDYDYATIKYNANGAEQWIRYYNGPEDKADQPTALVVDGSGNVYVTGRSEGSGQGIDNDFATIKYDANGNEEWVARFAGPGGTYDTPSALTVDGAGNVYVTGGISERQYDYLTIKYDANGKEQWARRYNGSGTGNPDDYATAVAVDGLGNVYVTGGSDGDYATIRYDASGVEQWVRSYNGPLNNTDDATDLEIDRSGNIYVTGRSDGVTEQSHYATIKYDASGTEQWVIRSPAPWVYEFGVDLEVDGSGNVYVAGSSVGSDTEYDYTTIKYQQVLTDPLAPLGVNYGTTGSANPTNPGALLTIDPVTGAATLIGPTGIVGDAGPSVPAIAIKSTGEIYGVSASTNSGLYTINASTGAGTFLTSTGVSLPNAMAFDGYDQLYISDGTNNLYTMDETTGETTLIGPLGFSVRGIAFDPTDGTMYGSSGTDEIYTIDPKTAVATFIGNTGLGGSTPDIHFDLDGNLFGTKIGGGTIYNYVSINKQTGIGTVIGSTGFIAVIGLSSRQFASISIPCKDIAQFKARCRPGGLVQAKAIFTDFTHVGETVKISVDQFPYEVEVGINGQATFSQTGFSPGVHTVELTDPPGCFPVMQVNCGAGDGSTTDAEWGDESVSSMTTALLGNYPNPFNPSTTFRYSLAGPTQVSLKVYNMLGQQVKTVVGDYQAQGYYEVAWDGRNDVGATVASGLYIYRMTAGSFVETRRMLLLK